MDGKNKVIIGAGIGLGLLGAGAVIKLTKSENERGQKDMLQFEYEGSCKEVEPIKELSPAEKEKISDMVKGMSESELRVVLENIPVGLMFDEVLTRLAHYNAFASQIQNAMEYLPK